MKRLFSLFCCLFLLVYNVEAQLDDIEKETLHLLSSKKHDEFVRGVVTIGCRNDWDANWLRVFIVYYHKSHPAAVHEVIRHCKTLETLRDVGPEIIDALVFLQKAYEKRSSVAGVEGVLRTRRLLETPELFVSQAAEFSIMRGKTVFTIGSCLTRETAKAMTSMYGAVPAIRNLELHRSDLLVRRFLEGNKDALPPRYLIDALRKKSSVTDAQYAQHMRAYDQQYGLGEGYDLLGEVGTIQPDFILIDPFIDIVGFLMHMKSEPSRSVFFNYRLFENGRDHFTEGQRIDVETSFMNFSKLIAALHISSPTSKMVFLNWNFDHRPNVETPLRAKQLAEYMSSVVNCLVIPGFPIAPYLKPGDPYHGSPEMYDNYARLIRSIAMK